MSLKQITLTLALLASVMSVNAAERTLNQDEFTSVSVTATSQSVSFTDPARQILVINDGANEVYIDFDLDTATTADFQLKVGESITVPITSPAIGIVCDTGETATARVLSLEENS